MGAGFIKEPADGQRSEPDRSIYIQHNNIYIHPTTGRSQLLLLYSVSINKYIHRFSLWKKKKKKKNFSPS